MRYAVVLPALDVLKAPELAAKAEAAGWDGVFVPDCIAIDVPGQPPFPAADTWVTLATIAMKTTRIRLGPLIAAVPRRRPWKLAREATSVDILSGGRLILPVGTGAAGDDAGFREVGEPMDLKTRLALLEECLDILTGLWTGEPFSYQGAHYRVGQMTQLPTPVQRPGVPIWVVGVWPAIRSVRRALRHDGIVVQKREGTLTPEDVRAIRELATRERPGEPFAIPVEGTTSAGDPAAAREQVRSWAEAGATWWIESMWTASPAEVEERVAAGPPK
jgi:alkanesulfonate monooxygenase SsuD/methylene tetrahydromethanopterin reductase-like flavin-dependent oxidoreductase (luciferase family)